MSTKVNQQLTRPGSQQANKVSNISETARNRLSQSSATMLTNPNLMNQGGNTTNNNSNSESATSAQLNKNSPAVKIISRIIFVKMGQIDTRNERFDAEAYIECSWEDDQIFKYLSSPSIGNKLFGSFN